MKDDVSEARRARFGIKPFLGQPMPPSERGRLEHELLPLEMRRVARQSGRTDVR
jgi:hypothetical protein